MIETAVPAADERKFTYEFQNSQPIELFDFTAAMNGLADEYKRFVQSADLANGEARLYIREMRKGSLIAELVSFVPAGAMQLISNGVTLLDFGSYIRAAIKLLLPGGDNESGIVLTKRSLDNLSKLVEPLVKDDKATLNITVTGHNNTVVIVDRMTALTANALQNRAKRLREEIEQPGAGRHEKVLMYWYQARNDAGQTGDKAIIESLSPKPIRTIFADPTQKRMALDSENNPFRAGLLVDVDVETRQGKPAVYKVVHVHEVVE